MVLVDAVPFHHRAAADGGVAEWKARCSRSHESVEGPGHEMMLAEGPGNITEHVAKSSPSAGTRRKPLSFTASLRRAHAAQELGMCLEAFEPSKLYVAKVDDGSGTLIGQYNAGADTAERIRVGDYIADVNGEVAPQAMLRLMRKGEFTLTLLRPQLFSAVVPSWGRPLGLRIKHDLDRESLTVTSISSSGAVRASRSDIACGDRIASVNGRSGSAKELLSELRRSNAPELTISRCGWGLTIPESFSKRCRPPLRTRPRQCIN